MKNYLNFVLAVVLVGVTLLLYQPVQAGDGVKNTHTTLPIIEDSTTFKIYDIKDNLVYEVVLCKKNSRDDKLVKYLNKSDLLIQYDNQKIYRLKK